MIYLSNNCSKTICGSSNHQHIMEFRILLITIRDAEGSQMLTEKPVIMSRWREYFNDLLICPATAREEARASVDQYPLQEDMANPPTLEEISAAIKSIKSGKTPGLDGIPAEVYKYGGTALLAQLLKFYR